MNFYIQAIIDKAIAFKRLIRSQQDLLKNLASISIKTENENRLDIQMIIIPICETKRLRGSPDIAIVEGAIEPVVI